MAVVAPDLFALTGIAQGLLGRQYAGVMGVSEAAWYDRYWQDGTSGWQPEAGLSRSLRSLLVRECEGRAVLDFGGGDGERYGDLLRTVASEYLVADVSPHVLGLRAAHGDRAVDVGHLAAVPDRFDVLVALEVFEHLLDPEAALTGAVSLLHPGGSALISVPNAFSWWNRVRMVAGRLPASGVGPPGVRGHTYDAPHIRFFDRASLTSLVTRAGLECSELFTDSIDLPRFNRFAPDRLWPVTQRSAILAHTLIARCRKP